MGFLKKFTRKLTEVRRKVSEAEALVRNSVLSKPRQRKRNETPPQAAKRDRALSICSGNAFKKEVSEQSGFGFFKLPLEIREMVYAELMPWERVWIMLHGKRLVCDWESTEPESPETPTRIRFPPLPVRPSQTGGPTAAVDSLGASPRESPASPPVATRTQQGPLHRNPLMPKPSWGLGILPFLQTCRRVYSEAIPYLYSRPDFAFHDTVPFLAFAASIPPSHFNQIRSVTINLAYKDASPVLPRHLQKRNEKAENLTIRRPERCSLDYTFFHDGSYTGKLYNASILPPQDSDPLLPSYMWDAIAEALEEMNGLQKVHVTLLDIPRVISVWVEHGYEHSGQRDARDIMGSLKWIGRARPWKGEEGDEDRKTKGRETEVVFENVWWKSDRDHKIRGHWIREIGDDGKVEWREVGEAAGAVVQMW